MEADAGEAGVGVGVALDSDNTGSEADPEAVEVGAGVGDSDGEVIAFDFATVSSSSFFSSGKIEPCRAAAMYLFGFVDPVFVHQQGCHVNSRMRILELFNRLLLDDVEAGSCPAEVVKRKRVSNGAIQICWRSVVGLFGNLVTFRCILVQQKSETCVVSCNIFIGRRILMQTLHGSIKIWEIVPGTVEVGQGLERFSAVRRVFNQAQPKLFRLIEEIPFGGQPSEIQLPFGIFTRGRFRRSPERFKFGFALVLACLPGGISLISQTKVVGASPRTVPRPALQSRPVFN